MTHEAIPMTLPPTESGPPESPKQIPCPACVNEQRVESKTNWAFPVVWAFRQATFVKVWVVMNCKLFGADPGF